MTARTIAKSIVKKERLEAMKRKEVYRKYRNSAGVKTLVTILCHQDEISSGVLEATLHYTHALTDQAMQEAEVIFNEFGQVDFADGIYFDFTMPTADKILLLSQCDTDQSDKIKELKELALCL